MITVRAMGVSFCLTTCTMVIARADTLAMHLEESEQEVQLLTESVAARDQELAGAFDEVRCSAHCDTCLNSHRLVDQLL